MRAKNEKANDLRIVLLEHFPDTEEIAERLGHLFIVNTHKAVVHPVIHKATLVRALRLGNLVFVVRKLQVLPTTVNIEMLAQEIGTHRRAFNVPARTTVTPRRSPGRFAFLGVLPEHKIERIVLGLVNIHTLTRAQVI